MIIIQENLRRRLLYILWIAKIKGKFMGRNKNKYKIQTLSPFLSRFEMVIVPLPPPPLI